MGEIDKSFQKKKDVLKRELELERQKYTKQYKSLDRTLNRIAIVMVLLAMILLGVYAGSNNKFNNGVFKNGIGYKSTSEYIQRQSVDIEEP
ncbi:MAG: hypothetical protein E7262_04915 [Lachnospiraceae bacterium]|nr:hypothetical protein [Lachnospiraceae bacterium]